jgi:hypothetical protein
MSNSYLSNSENKDTDWISLINESVHTKDDEDIGDICAVSRNFVVVKRGLVNVHYYYIPVKKVEGWDGDVLWLKVTENELKEKYERNTSPDPKQYYVNEFPYYTAAYYYPLPLIPRRRLALGNIPNDKRSLPLEEVSWLFTCNLCNQSFKSEDELDKHMEIVGH